MEGSLGEIISRAPKMSPVEEKSSLASVQEDLHDYLTPGESRLLVAVEKNPLDYDSWMELLDVTEREGSHEKVVRLYERCLVPCAACADIWMRYVDFLEEAKMLTDASAVLSRALCFVEREEQLEFCLFSARYKERIGDISGARQQYHEILSKLSPGSLEVLEAHANMERRLGDDEKALKDPLKFVTILYFGTQKENNYVTLSFWIYKCPSIYRLLKIHTNQDRF
uniref:Uncharacterized protein n=1 Tax=Arundo donax TaxID=35708 RepID=A0A0A9BV27_ARUDO